MHGWLALPGIYYVALAIAAPVMGAVGRLLIGPGSRSLLWWLVLSAVHSLSTVGIAFLYQYSVYPGHYVLNAWLWLLAPTLGVALLAVGAGWVVTGGALRFQKRRLLGRVGV